MVSSSPFLCHKLKPGLANIVSKSSHRRLPRTKLKKKKIKKKSKKLLNFFAFWFCPRYPPFPSIL